ncbi:MAG: hypothetical protein R2715_24730 [Ilumatobacteraceae bacterium]
MTDDQMMDTTDPAVLEDDPTIEQPGDADALDAGATDEPADTSDAADASDAADDTDTAEDAVEVFDLRDGAESGDDDSEADEASTEDEAAGTPAWLRSGDWYVIHSQSGYEKKVKANLGLASCR